MEEACFCRHRKVWEAVRQLEEMQEKSGLADISAIISCVAPLDSEKSNVPQSPAIVLCNEDWPVEVNLVYDPELLCPA